MIIDAFALEGAEAATKQASVGHQHDPHLWLSPPLLKLAANRIAAGLTQGIAAGTSVSGNNAAEKRNSSKIDGAQIAARLSQVKAEIDSVEEAVRRTLGASGQSRQKFFVFHPSWGEYAKVFGLEQVALEADGHAPSPADMQRFIAAMKGAKAKIIYTQPQFSIKDAQSAAQHAGARVVMVDPLAEDQFGGFIQFAQALRADFDERK